MMRRLASIPRLYLLPLGLLQALTVALIIFSSSSSLGPGGDYYLNSNHQLLGRSTTTTTTQKAWAASKMIPIRTRDQLLLPRISAARHGGSYSFPRRNAIAAAAAASTAQCNCDGGTATIKSTGSPIKVTAGDLRDMTLLDANGEHRDLGDSMGSGKSIVVFLRHLG
mmetsp:Transcript_8056/g.9798  ORF Transcript_8056/g.9798 Transcript_8056/m.9798 type:complete len:167 (-) Transcript_8056:803-1303(-)|eukprot:jgi/Bigna1/62344/fgenesh1_kg.34_\